MWCLMSVLRINNNFQSREACIEIRLVAALAHARHTALEPVMPSPKLSDPSDGVVSWQ
jgi:hypothetical protein